MFDDDYEPKTSIDELLDGKKPEEKVITVMIDDREFLVTPSEAISIINQVSGVLLAYEHTR